VIPGLTADHGRTTLGRLRQFVRQPRAGAGACELCATLIAAAHSHLLEMEKRQVICACDACAILFDGNTRQRYRRIPRDVYRLTSFAMDDHEWERLLIPINLAFFLYSSAAQRTIAQYPSPGGVAESSLDLDDWDRIVQRNPILERLEPDVEALLVNRIGDPPQYFRVPIDRCFQLVGIMRTHWRGFSGGELVWTEIDGFFRELTANAGA
jgi:hypothetical protein